MKSDETLVKAQYACRIDRVRLRYYLIKEFFDMLDKIYIK